MVHEFADTTLDTEATSLNAVTVITEHVRPQTQTTKSKNIRRNLIGINTEPIRRQSNQEKVAYSESETGEGDDIGVHPVGEQVGADPGVSWLQIVIKQPTRCGRCIFIVFFLGCDRHFVYVRRMEETGGRLRENRDRSIDSQRRRQTENAGVL